jgi:ribosomal 50S subunit-recycling heat shock protein
MANNSIKQIRTKANGEVDVKKRQGDRAYERALDRQDAKTEESNDVEKCRVIGVDERTTKSQTYLHPQDMLRLLLYQTQVREAVTRIQNHKAELENAELSYLKRQLEIGKRHSAASIEHASALKKLRHFHSSIETAYEIKLSNISFDDETGLIFQRVE